MWQPTLPPNPVVAEWWQRAEQARDAEEARAASARAAADIQRLRRKVQNIKETVQYALTTSEARRHVARNFGPAAAADISLRPAVRPSVRHAGRDVEARDVGPIEYSRQVGRVLRVR